MTFEPTQSVTYNRPSRTPLKSEELVAWATEEWQKRWPDQPYHTVWAATQCAHALALKRLKPGRKLRGKARYAGYQPLWCPYSIPVNEFSSFTRRSTLTEGIGAYIFNFTLGGETVPVLYVAAYFMEDRCDHESEAIALVPVNALDAWADFEKQCLIAAYRMAHHSKKVYIIGGSEKSFTPSVKWDDIILPAGLKQELRTELETFFSEGVDIYKQVNLPPFRKLLFVGPPGTGKSMLCAALAKVALEMKCIVIYVSSADEDGTRFDKIQRALRRVAHSAQPTLLIIEELDAYLKDEDKAQILNVLDGFEVPNNPRGALLIATTNYPEKIDERIAKRPGRVDRIIHLPTIQDEDQARQMLKHYMGIQWVDEHAALAEKLVGQTGAFVREIVLYARMMAVNLRETRVSLDLLIHSFKALTQQVESNHALEPRRPIGFLTQSQEPQYLNRSGG